jgi:NhaP-type Na+/H+ or K+/H+ antiporter
VEYTEDSGQLLAAASFFLFGNVLVPIGLHRPSPAVVVCAVATLTVGRLLPVAVSLIRSGTAWQTQAFVGWFGPRGLASIVFGLILLEEHVPRAQQLFSVIVLTVLLSVVAHGATAGWGARRYGAWYAASGRHEASAAESQPVREHRSRWRGDFSG